MKAEKRAFVNFQHILFFNFYAKNSMKRKRGKIKESISDQPEVECGQGTIAVRVRTASQKPSYIFAKGHFHKDGCHFKQTNHATFHFEQCNVNRKREVSKHTD